MNRPPDRGFGAASPTAAWAKARPLVRPEYTTRCHKTGASTAPETTPRAIALAAISRHGF